MLSAVIIAGNEEAKIGDAIDSVAFADEVLVVDSESTDRTREIAGSMGARVVVKPWAGFAKQKQFAADEARHNWILSIDADERVSPQLRLEIEAVMAGGAPSADAYRIPRLTTYMGREIRHSGWYPDFQTRLFDRTKGRWSDVLVHESFQLFDRGRLGRLKSDLLHLSVDGALEHNAMVGERYARLAAEEMFRRGSSTGAFRVVTAGPAAFLNSYLLKLGFLDGLAGYVIARFASQHAFLKHLVLLERQRGGGLRASATEAPGEPSKQVE